MAASGSQTIQLYYSTSSGTAPVAGNLVSGEIALNITDGKLYYKDNGGTVQLLASKAAASGSFSDITASGNVTLSGGTANGVAYLNGSKVLTTGSALVFDGSTLLVGQTSKTTGAGSGANLGVTAGITITNGSYGGYIEGVNTSGTLSGYLSFGSSYNAFNAGEVGLGTSGSVDLLFATNNAVRGRFTSGGYFKASSDGTYVNSTASYYEFRQTTASQASVYNTNTTADPYGIRMSYTGASPNSTDNWFLYCEDSGPTLRMSVRSNGGIANYSGNNVNLSDRREKTNFAPAGEYLSKICAIPVQTFNYIDQSEDDPGLTLGVVAQDVQAVAPELVMESNWGTKDEPKIRLSIYQTDLQYALMKALQELKAEFDAYKATHP